MKIVNCIHWTADNQHRGICGLNLFGGKPSFSPCAGCSRRSPKDATKPAIFVSAESVTVNSQPQMLALPREEWPAQANDLAAFAIEADKGLGDVYYREKGDPDTGQKVRTLAQAISVGCGCRGNAGPFLNQRYPLKKNA